MIQLNMIKKTKSTHILALFWLPCLQHMDTITLYYPGALHITQFHGTLHWYAVILAKQTAHAESHNLLPTKCPQSGSDTRCHAHCQASAGGRSRRLIRCDAKHTQQLEVIVSWCKQGRGTCVIVGYLTCLPTLLIGWLRGGSWGGGDVGISWDGSLALSTDSGKKQWGGSAGVLTAGLIFRRLQWFADW